MPRSRSTSRRSFIQVPPPCLDDVPIQIPLQVPHHPAQPVDDPQVAEPVVDQHQADQGHQGGEGAEGVDEDQRPQGQGQGGEGQVQPPPDWLSVYKEALRQSNIFCAIIIDPSDELRLI